MTASFRAKVAIDMAVSVSRRFEPAKQPSQKHVVPDELRDFLARLRLLESVPFAYLVPDSELLPPESIRFFYVDREWTDALVQGALSVGTVSTADRAQLEAVYSKVRDEVDEEERRVRLPLGEPPLTGAAGTITGILLRSRAVSGWPALHVRGYRAEPATRDDENLTEDHPDRLKLLRMERLAPAVLLVLFDGVPEVVHIEEPRSGIQFGVHLTPTAQPNQFKATTAPRDSHTADKLAAAEMDVPFRPGAPGVIHVTDLVKDLISTAGTNLTPAADSAEFAVEMLRFPYRQVFGNPRENPGSLSDVFHPKVALAALHQRFSSVLHP
ncbi:MAG: hypothetical protein ABIS03_00590 [Gemmatimonadaceae bacterium]